MAVFLVCVFVVLSVSEEGCSVKISWPWSWLFLPAILHSQVLRVSFEGVSLADSVELGLSFLFI